MIICFMPSLADRMRRPVFEVAAAGEAAVEAAVMEPDEDATCFKGEDGLLPPPGEARPTHSPTGLWSIANSR